MLVLSRKKGEAIIIGDGIEVTVLGVEGDVVKLGIQAPKEVDIYRKEIYTGIQEANKEAAKMTIGLEGLKKLEKRGKT
ncbi:carbon storage regulator CsrA [Paenibacillus sp. YN15]|uniref:carbon storage regulator CsrA n=1 Tax=Paenibacillus sp. YN15 TaxID=1742774 RepID=UPI000DCBA78C|nr:carbon storage regulator CsrA [Paenibacillus sp. YN15]RAV03105.1 carbon storage regulator [Paenibacillus sp. YN15]